MPEVIKRLVIRGRVQGVFYRAWSAEEAGRLGLRGWVRNRLDGSVEMLLSGSEGEVAAMIERCRQGPPAALVEAIQIEEAEETPPPRFEKRPTA